MDAVSHLLRRSRLRGFVGGAGHSKNHPPRLSFADNASLDERTPSAESGDYIQLDERFYASLNQFSPEELSSIQAASSAAAAKQSAASVTSTQRQAAQAATRGTTLSSRIPTVTSVRQTITKTSTVVVVPSTAKAIPSSARSSVAVPSSSRISSASAVQSTSSSRTTTTTSSVIATSTIPLNTNTVLTVTEGPPSASAASSSSAAASAGTAINAAASGSSSHTSGLSTGGLVGVILAVLLGLVALGSTVGWLYRKYSSRFYSSRSPWSKMDDDDGVTPFPPNEKLIDHDSDIYGSSAAPVIGSRRALALARNNAFASDGSLRPDSEYMDNRAGLGAGAFPAPALVSPDYGVDAQGRPYRQQAGRTPIPYAQNGYGLPNNPHPMMRQAGPPGYPYEQPGLSPVALGRPSVPNTRAQLAQLDDFADMPEPNATGAYLAYEDEEPYTPMTASSDNHWNATPPQNKSRVSMTAPKPLPQMPFQSVQRPPPAAPLPLPVLEPMSPLMNGFDIRRSSQPLAMYLPESTPGLQKRLYGEVAQAAGVAEPVTPHYPTHPNNSTSSTTSHQTTSSFSAHEPNSTPTMAMRLPSLTLPPSKPYIHGQPLSPLTEVATPLSINTVPAQASSSILHGQRSEVNPFERALIPPKRNSRGSDGLVPPYTAGPSPAFPPPSPGGMSVPGSVGSSPRRWSGGVANRQGLRETRGDSVFDGENAYGGI